MSDQIFYDPKYNLVNMRRDNYSSYAFVVEGANQDITDWENSYKKSGRGVIIYDKNDNIFKVSENNGNYVPMLQTIPPIPPFYNFLSGSNMNVSVLGNDVTYGTISNPTFTTTTTTVLNAMTFRLNTDHLTISQNGLGTVFMTTQNTGSLIIRNGLLVGVTFNGNNISAGSINTSGNATIGGNLTVTGTVNGRNIITDGTNLDTLVGMVDQPVLITSSPKFNELTLTSSTPLKLFAAGSSNKVSTVSALHWDPTNSRLGINTSTPSTTLHVNSTVSTPNLMLSNTLNTDNRIFAYLTNSGTADPLFRMVAARGLVSNSVGDVMAQLGLEYGGVIGSALRYHRNATGTDSFISMSTNTTEKMRIDSNGNVGIGLISPSEKLDISGNIKASGSGSVGTNMNVGGTVLIGSSCGINVGSPSERLDVGGNIRASGTMTIIGNALIGGALSLNTINSSAFVLQNPNSGSNNSSFIIRSGTDASSYGIRLDAWSDGSITTYTNSGTSTGNHRMRARINSTNDTVFSSISNNGVTYDYMIIGSNNLNNGGAMRYNNSGNLQFYNGSWQNILYGSSPSLSGLTVTGNLTVNGSNRANYGDFNNLNAYTDPYMKINNRAVFTQFASQGDAFNYFQTLGGVGMMGPLIGNGSPSGTSIGDSDYLWLYGKNNATSKRYYQISSTAFFTGQHCVKCDTVNYENIYDYIGKIVCATGTYIKEKTVCEALPNVELSTRYKQKNVFGVISNINNWNNGNVDYVKAHNDGWSSGLFDDSGLLVNSIGEGCIWVISEIQDMLGMPVVLDPIENGDYITTSDVEGYGCLQKEPTLCNFTVAKITQDESFNDAEEFEYNGKTYRKAFVGCTYHCG